MLIGAGAIHAGLFESHWFDSVNDFEAKSLSRAKMYILSVTRDGASSNNKLMAARLNTLKGIVCSDKICSLHKHKAIESNLLVTLGVNILADLYRASNLLRMGGWLAAFHFRCFSAGGCVECCGHVSESTSSQHRSIQKVYKSTYCIMFILSGVSCG